MELAVDLGQRLKQETQQLHDEAEHHAFQKQFGGGHLPRDAYVRYLAQMRLLYTALEDAIRSAGVDEPALRTVICDDNFREGDLRSDLDFFGADPAAARPLPAVQRVIHKIERLAAEQPIALLGMHYVLEGSNNGSKFIAKNIRRAYSLDGRGASYLDPYGDEQRQQWMQYKQRMTALELDDKQRDAVVDAAKYLFRGLMGIFSDLHVQSAA